MPTISSWPSLVTSPTSATTLEVPMSRPTIILPLCALLIVSCLFSIHFLLGRSRLHRLTPGHGQAVGITQVDARDVRALFFQLALVDSREPTHFFHDMITPQQHLDALPAGILGGREEPTATLAQLQP